MANKRIYAFGNGRADGGAKDKGLLGGKGANLAEMMNLGLPVPPGFTITTEVCKEFQDHGDRLPEVLHGELEAAVEQLEATIGRRFGDVQNPLLVSVRSGAPVSMPGMMDTILNLGMNDEVVEGLATKMGDRRFAYDSYRRLIAMYGNVVLEMKGDDEGTMPFEHALSEAKRRAGVELDSQLDASQLTELVSVFKGLVREHAGQEFPQSPRDQLLGATRAVFRSWNNDRAITYRKLNDIPSDIGTAVNVQAMVFGNMGESSATGVAFSRDPNSGEARFFGEYLVNAQGEDVVAGIRTPSAINGDADDTLEKVMPEVYGKLDDTRRLLEKHYRDMQDIEFTIQQGELFLLQTRTGKRTAAAAVRMAVDMVHEGLIDKKEAVRRVTPAHVDQL
ncbi:MAG: PEP/pyruvate-binding domain-containing protein, partial [Myxococcota bacterium]